MLARQHVNQMCVMSGIPLIESGTTGLLGQVFCATSISQSSPILSFLVWQNVMIVSLMKAIESSIRFVLFEGTVFFLFVISSTPEKIEHCIVFGKELFSLLLGHKEDSLLYEESNHTYRVSVVEDVVDTCLFSPHCSPLQKRMSLSPFMHSFKDYSTMTFSHESVWEGMLSTFSACCSYKTLLKTPEPISILDHKVFCLYSLYSYRMWIIILLLKIIPSDMNISSP